jgi:enamine deaminase RidA (YjgF/YER057c/UK114 family)
MVRGYVNATDDFALVHKVIDAASDLLIAELGEKGRHARSVVGCATLPNNNAVTLEAVAILA